MSTVKAGENIFEALGFDTQESANLRLRSQLMIELSKYIEANKLTQTDAADIFAVNQPRISDLVNGKINKFTIDMLINMLSKTGQSVELTIKAA